ncbi:hypothetical protein BGZ63DRAFT_418401 [Mariannaea sp. PMI_226]|nr:hypothetical protein BGZ63DRAFT_418401 [Mariannaea sp. PMI_226]
MSAPKPPPGHLNVLYFASASSFTGKDYEAIPANLPLKNLFVELESRYPGIKERILDSCLVTVNLDYVDVEGEEGSNDTILREADEVAIIPPGHQVGEKPSDVEACLVADISVYMLIVCSGHSDMETSQDIAVQNPTITILPLCGATSRSDR